MKPMRSLALVALTLLASTVLAADPPAPPLSWRLEKGAVLRYRYTTDQTTRHRQPNAPPETDAIETHQVERVEYRLTVLENDLATGTARVLCRYDQVAIELDTMALGKSAWDSKKEEDRARADDPAVRPFAHLLGQEFSFVLGADGAVSDVRGLDAVRRAVMAGLEDSAYARTALGGVFSDEAVRGELERGFRCLPPRGAAPGATWRPPPFEQPIPLLGTLVYDVDSKLESLDGGTATTSFKVRLSKGAPPAPAAGDPIAQTIAVDLREGSGEGRAVFSATRGALERSEATFAMKLATRLLEPVAPKSGPKAVEALSEVAEKVTVERID
jgi:hypothetical protein